MLCAASISTWALDLSKSMASEHITKKTEGIYTQLTIKMCGKTCRHTLKDILDAAKITEDDHIDLIRFGTYDIPAGWNTVYQYSFNDEINKIVESFPNLKAYTIDLRKVKNLGSWKRLTNDYLSNLLLQYNSSLGLLDNSVVENFNSEKLYNVIVLGEACTPCQRTEIDAYVNKPGMLAYGLQYISEVAEQAGYGKYNDNKAWWNTGTPNGGNGYSYYSKAFTKVRLSGYVFARDIMSIDAPKLTPEGHLTRFMMDDTYQNVYKYCPGSKCDNPLAPSYNDPNVVFPLGKADADGHGEYGGHYLQGAMMGSHVYSFDFTNAQYGELVEEVFANLINVHQYDADESEDTVWKREFPDIRSQFHPLDSELYYMVSNCRKELEKAFLSGEGVADLTEYIVQKLFTSAESDRFLLMKPWIFVTVASGGHDDLPLSRSLAWGITTVASGVHDVLPLSRSLAWVITTVASGS